MKCDRYAKKWTEKHTPGGEVKVMTMRLRMSRSDSTAVRRSCVARCSYEDECPCSDGVES